MGETGSVERRLAFDVVAGIAIVVVALAAGLEALTFNTTFPTDPLGPKVFPLLDAALLVAGGAWIGFRPGLERLEPMPRAVWVAAASFVAYALLLEPLGFLLATIAEFMVLSRLFGGCWLRSALAGAAFAVALYLLFVNGLGLVLPVGSVFIVGG